MPLLSIVVPAYNAQDYLRRALEPLKEIDADIEVLIINDGSTDGTGALAEAYAQAFPARFTAIHQENAGHGGAINTGIARATGEYLKVLDADDWLSIPALIESLSVLRMLEGTGGVDALVTDYVHDRVAKSNRLSSFASVFPQRRCFGWDDVQRFTRRQYLMMHALVFRTELLRRSGLVLPEHTFYVDSLYVVTALREVRTMYYLPVALYHYFIGREDQSVNETVMLRRVDQHVRVNRLALHALPTSEQLRSGEVPRMLAAALFHYVTAMCAVTSATLARGGTAEHLALRAEFWREIRRDQPWVYDRLRRTLVGASSNLPGHAGRRVTSMAYHVARRVVGFS